MGHLLPVAASLSFGGPPGCGARPLCLAGLERVYGLKFAQFFALDTGGPLTVQALRTGGIDVGLLFTTDPSIEKDGLVLLADDRGLQPAENVVPLVRSEVLARWGTRLTGVVDGVSQLLTTEELRRLNARLTEGSSTPEVAKRWLSENRLG